jgi:uncharacterized membrane protein
MRESGLIVCENLGIDTSLFYSIVPMHLGLVARAPLAIQIHLATVIPAFFLGTWLLFFSRKGSLIHRRVGFVYLTLMSVTAITAMFIRSIRPGHLSWIHLFVPLTVWGVFGALWSIRRHDIAGHRRAMYGLYFGALIIAGGFTFYPGRLMYRIFFG